MSWIIWGLLIVLQNAAFVANSRARNSASIKYHAVTNICSNGIWIISLFFATDKVTEVLRTSNWHLAVVVCIFYTILNLIGGLTTHHFLLKRKL